LIVYHTLYHLLKWARDGRPVGRVALDDPVLIESPV